jgi:uncharacterized protein YeaO (DUF488 family)
MDIFLKRAYDKAATSDGYRILVDRLWPRGVKKSDLRLHSWAKELAPSTALRKWFAHDATRWSEFRSRYRKELATPRVSQLIKEVIAEANAAPAITLIYAARDTEHNEAVVLREKIRRFTIRASRRV